MTAPIAQRLRDAVAALTTDRVSMQAMVHARGAAAHGTVLLPMACLAYYRCLARAMCLACGCRHEQEFNSRKGSGATLHQTSTNAGNQS